MCAGSTLRTPLCHCVEGKAAEDTLASLQHIATVTSLRVDPAFSLIPFRKTLCGESLDPCAVLPGVRRQACFAAGPFEEPFAGPDRLPRHLRQQDSPTVAPGRPRSVTSDFTTAGRQPATADRARGAFALAWGALEKPQKYCAADASANTTTSHSSRSPQGFNPG